MSGPARTTTQRGFTLLELIVAAGIMALIAVFSWRGLDTLIREREAIAESQATIDAMQRSFARLERDALLADDVQLDDGGTLRLVAGASSSDGTTSATVEYRLADGTLTRTVVGGGAAPLVVLDRLASLTIEAYVPAAGGGTWVRTKAPPAAPPAATDPANKPAAAAQAGAAQANAAPQANVAPLARTNAAPTVPGATRGAQAPGLPVLSAATAVRVAFARGDGTRVLRSFLVGGG